MKPLNKTKEKNYELPIWLWGILILGLIYGGIIIFNLSPYEIYYCNNETILKCIK